jgi:hypothetical protein
LRQAAYVACYVLIWAVPGFLLAEVVTHKVRHEWRPTAVALSVAATLWLMFPVSFLSSMSSGSVWTPLAPSLIARMLRRFVDSFIFFLLTAILVGVCAPLLPLLVADGRVITLLGGGIVLGLALVLYARLSGRMAFIVRLSDAPVKRKKRPKMKRVRGAQVTDPWEVPEDVRLEEEARGGGFTQPSDMPTMTGALDEELSGYDVNFHKSTENERQGAKTEPDGRDPLPQADQRTARQTTREQKNRVAHGIKPDELEMRRLMREEEKRHAHPWLEGIWLFPFQPQAAIQWCILSIEFIVIGLLARGLIATWPGGE